MWALFKFIILIPTTALCEYRAYQYALLPPMSQDSNSQSEKTLQSKKPVQLITTLNPLAYQSYLGSKKSQLYLMRTWICPGVTARKKICPSPYASVEELEKSGKKQ